METPSDVWGDQFDTNDRALLAPFVTDLDAPIFGLRNLPEVVKGALFSRYSRSDKSLRRILLDEFIQSPEAGFSSIVGGAANAGHEQIVATQQAEAFYERVLIGYGDDSVAELGGAHLACEGISNIAAKALEDSRIGLSPLEKSTRYVVFNRKVAGRYRYYRPPELADTAELANYEAALDGLFDTYSALLEPTIAHVRQRTPREAGTSERAYNSATRAKACDILRGLLPMATLTNVGLFGNGRAFEYLLSKLYAAPEAELNQLATALQTALDALIPSFVKRPKTERGRHFQQYLRGMRERVAAHVPQTAPSTATESVGFPGTSVTLIDYDHAAELRCIAAILYPHSTQAFATVRSRVAELSAEQRANIIQAYLGERASRFDRPGRAFELPFYTFDLLADLGAYRDLQRHRMLTQERQAYTIQHGYITPPELADAGLSSEYSRALEGAAAAFRKLEQHSPVVAAYCVPFAFRVRWQITLNLREVYHLCELRSAPQGHPTYRAIAQEIYRQVAATHPALAAGMRFVDLNDYALERLDAERRLDAKLAKQV